MSSIELGDITDPRLLWVKGALFGLLALLAASALLLEAPSFRVAGLLALTVWASCRTYYFGFYVIERYIGSDRPVAGWFDGLRRCTSRGGGGDQ